MVRRENASEQGQKCWALIRQMDHAVLAAEVIPYVGMDQFPTHLHEQVTLAVRHHDDGWQQWDSEPEVDSGGRPIAFDEMRPLDVLAIWRKSIASAASFGPLPGYAVAGHFLTLLERFTSWNRQGEPALAEAEQFRRDYVEASQRWRKEFTVHHGEHDAALLDPAVQYLRTLDWISLWLCNNWPDPVLHVQTGDFQPRIQLRRIATANEKVQTVDLNPWRSESTPSSLGVAAKRVVQQTYADRRILAEAVAETITLQWQFRPQPA